MFGINGWEALILIVLGVIILGPERLPEYAAKLAQGVRKLRIMAEGARVTLKDQLGPEYQDINWRQYDPRQYDPRRIVREALAEPLEYVAQPFKEVADEVRGVRDEVRGVGAGASGALSDSGSATTAAAGVGVAGTAAAVAVASESSHPGHDIGQPAFVAVGPRSYWDNDAT